jgi:hypothetical protein
MTTDGGCSDLFYRRPCIGLWHLADVSDVQIHVGF